MAIGFLSSSASTGAQLAEAGGGDAVAHQEQQAQHGLTLGQTTGPTQPTGPTPQLGVGVPGAGLAPSAQQQQMVASADAVKLNTGEYVAKADFDKLSPADQALLMQVGIASFNQQKQADLQNFLNNNVKLGSGEYVSKADYSKLSAADQALLMTWGIAKFNQIKNQEYQSFSSQNTQLPTGEWIPNYFYNDLTAAALSAIKGGMAAFNAWLAGKTPSDVFKDGGWKPDFTKPNPYDGMPFWYQAWEAANFVPTPSNPNPPSAGFTGGTGTPPATVGTVGVAPTPGEGVTGWKPDFTKPDPYAGAPLSYYQQEMAGFIPTASNPLPPSLTYLQANPNTTLVPPTAPITPQPFTQADFTAYQMATPLEKFNLLVSKGYIPKGSEFAGVNDKGELTFLTPENVLRNQLVALWNKKVEELKPVQGEQDRQYQEQLRSFEAKLKDAPKELQDAYAKGGISEYLRQAKVYEDNIVAAQQSLEPYKKTFQGPYITASGESQAGWSTYDIQKYLLDNKNSAESLQNLKTLNFPQAGIDQARDNAEYILRTVTYLDSLTTSSGKKGPTLTGSGSQELMAFTRAADEVGLLKGDMPGVRAYLAGRQINVNIGQYDVFWKSLSDSQKQELAARFASDPYKSTYFASLVADLNVTASKDMATGLLLSPVTPIVTPIAKVTIPDSAIANQVKDTIAYLNQNPVLSADETKALDKAIKGAQLTGSWESLSAADKQRVATDYTRVQLGLTPTATEWTVAGLVAALDVLTLGGAQALGGLGVGGKLASSALSTGTPLALGVVQAPSVVKTIASPDVGIAEKIVSGGSEVLLVGLPLAGTAIRGAEFVKLTSRDDYVPLRGMSMEAQTARGFFTPAQLARMDAMGVTTEDILAAGTKINEQLVAGARVAEVDLGGVKFTVRNIPYQTDVGLSLFQSTPDISVIDRGGSVPIIKEFYTAGKVAIEPLERSYLTGQRAIHPGIVELRIDDPLLIEKIAPQRKTIGGLEPEAPIPSLDELQGMGYRLEPIPGPAGRGVTFDANLGEIQIRRFTLAKVTDNPSGLSRTVLGGSGNGGTVAIGDLHGTENSAAVFHDINSGFKDPLVSGDPNNPNTWHAVAAADKGRTVVILGDSIDRGPIYETWRSTFNRLHDEALANGDKVERLLGNHELAYLSDDAISGITYTDATRAVIKKGIVDDLATGRVKAALSADGKLFSHAGVSTGVFPEFKGKSPEFIADELNTKLQRAAKTGDFGDKAFAKGRTEKGHSLSMNEREQGGPFWLRPQEAALDELNLGFEQVVGHNPGWGVRRIWGDNFIEADVSRRTGGTGAFVDTPFVTDKPIAIGTRSLGGVAPDLPESTMVGLRLKAMRDTVADVFLGWDGRVKAIERIKTSTEATKRLLESLDKQIEERIAAGDSIGVKYLERQKDELISPTGSDYLYGGIGLWRDIVMGRQNSVKILDSIGGAASADLAKAVGVIDATRSRITDLPDTDIERFFGTSKQAILSGLDTSGIDTSDVASARQKIAERLTSLRDIVDVGVDRSVVGFLPEAAVVRGYSERLQSEVDRGRGITEARNRPSEVERVESPRGIATPAEPISPIPPYAHRGVPPYQPAVPPYGVVPPPYTPQPPTAPYPPQPPYNPPPPIGITPPPEGPKYPILTALPAEWEKTGVPKGVLTWRQGRYWVILPPPYRDEDKMYLTHPIPGTYKFSVGKGSAYRTLQVVNGQGAEDADVDMGWAQVHIRSKGRDLEMSFAGGEDAANDRWNAERAAMEEYERMAYASMPQGEFTERIPRYRTIQRNGYVPEVEEQPVEGLNKQLIPEYSTDGVKIYSVNGPWIRQTYANRSIGDRKGVDWAGGGHSGVYWNIIPKDEIWVDETLQGNDRDAFILHEIEERDLMLNKGMEYSEAHNDYANKVEIQARQNPHEMEDMLAEMIRKYHSNGNGQNGNGQTRARRSNGRRRAPIEENGVALPRRTYLGRRLRPIELY